MDNLYGGYGGRIADVSKYIFERAMCNYARAKYDQIAEGLGEDFDVKDLTEKCHIKMIGYDTSCRRSFRKKFETYLEDCAFGTTRLILAVFVKEYKDYFSAQEKKLLSEEKYLDDLARRAEGVAIQRRDLSEDPLSAYYILNDIRNKKGGHIKKDSSSDYIPVDVPTEADYQEFCQLACDFLRGLDPCAGTYFIQEAIQDIEENSSNDTGIRNNLPKKDILKGVEFIGHKDEVEKLLTQLGRTDDNGINRNYWGEGGPVRPPLCSMFFGNMLKKTRTRMSHGMMW